MELQKRAFILELGMVMNTAVGGAAPVAGQQFL
jgi:hypothetical protein